MPEKMITKIYRAEVKSFDDKAGTVDMLIPVSTDSMDRDHEVIEAGAWKKTLTEFNKRPVLLSSHDYRDLRAQIGEFQKLNLGEHGLLGLPRYYIGEGNEQADWGFNLAKKGMAAFSVGFIPLKWSDGDGEKEPRRTYNEVELLEISQVCVPSNRDAIQGIRSKSADPVILGLCDEVEKQIVTKPEETEQYFRVPVATEAGKHDGHRIRTIDISAEKGIKALYCGQDKVVITYLFSKDEKYGWTMESAKDWVKEHGKTARIISQDELRDEIDYCLTLIRNSELSVETKTSAKLLAAEIKRLAGDDTPVEIPTNPEPLSTPRIDIKEVAKVVAQEMARLTGKIV